MKKTIAVLCFLVSCHITPAAIAQIVDPADVDVLFNFAEQAEPTLFFPSGAVTSNAEPGWLFRYYSGSQSYAAVHLGSSGAFIQGGVYVLGGPFGDVVTYVDTLANLIVLVNSSNPGSGLSGITNAGNGNCVQLNLPRVGALAAYQTVAQDGGVPVIVNFTQEMLEVSNTRFVARHDQQSSISGIQSSTVSTSTNNFQIDGDVRYITSIVSDITSTIPGFGSNSQTSEITYSPRLFNGPADTYCEGQEWYVAPVTQTITTSPAIPGQTGSTSNQLSEHTAAVTSVSESVTVPAGTFSTVRLEIIDSGVRTINWSDPNSGLLIRAEGYDDNNMLRSTTELQSVN